MSGIVGTIWEHYKNKRHYQVVATAINPNTNERIIIYAAPDTDENYWRRRDLFLEKFTRVRS